MPLGTSPAAFPFSSENSQLDDVKRLLEHSLEATYKFRQRNPERLAYVAQFQEVETALSRFEFADNRLRSTEGFSQILLPHSRFHSQLSEDRQQSLLLFAVGA